MFPTKTMFACEPTSRRHSSIVAEPTSIGDTLARGLATTFQYTDVELRILLANGPFFVISPLNGWDGRPDMPSQSMFLV